MERRPTEYPSRGKAQRARSGRRAKSHDDPGGAGYEIAREAIACAACAEEQLAKEAAQADALGI
ncbi:MAG: hypothetical protein OES69_02825 [Myxococcales bacterium]|jgi:hypothetical protein|nr:hypothetical protein [Myxococcales bacterium]MDH3842844.1 hypothetical protein [Myxococcales bacterium]